MSTYWITFRIHDSGNSQERRDDLYAAINDISTMWWVEPTSFIVFESSESADTIAAKAKAAIRPSVDIVLLGMTEFKTARLIGAAVDHDIDQLIPFLKRV
ncbi:hypothetical protein [Tardiphaga robiniae]|uniref:GYD domain-containing protein n=1 Tax=Tardiphaga robiniae TaxID=943830 RepID=A0A161SPQ7_9BRAD|nr:hypothetical protein [Tardiphaga robiniae]KZD22802.1 hypothetical protein A4A58_28090 [Tardiphaga robiniae]